MTDDLTKTELRIKWPNGRETICRCNVLVEAGASAKQALDILGGRVLAIIDLKFIPDGYRPSRCRSRKVDTRECVVRATLPARETGTRKRMPVPKPSNDWLQKAQTDLFESRDVEEDTVRCRRK